MRVAKPILLAFLSLAMAAYAFDCGAMTPGQAMQCCKSMPCPSQGHSGQNCCKTMGASHAPFVQVASARGVSLGQAMFSVILAPDKTESMNSSTLGISTHCHAPPVFSLSASLPLRV